MDKYEIAQILREIGIIIELTDKTPLKGLAYRKAANTIESIANLKKVIKDNALETYPGIGKEISKMVVSLSKNGKLSYYTTLSKQVPKSLLDLVGIPGLTTKKIRNLYETLHITELDELEKALQDGRCSEVDDFSLSVIRKLSENINEYKTHGITFLYPLASHISNIILEILKDVVDQIEITGGLRRKLEMVNQIDFIATTPHPKTCFFKFTTHGTVKKVLSLADNEAKILLKNGLKVNLSIVPENEFPFGLLFTTGSENHIGQLQMEAFSQNVRINCHHMEFVNESVKKEIKNENEIYLSLGMEPIPPELREGFGEVYAAKTNSLPKLIEEKDLKGTFHCHTIYSDGANSIEEMAGAAQGLGWEYIGITDHSRSTYQANGMDESRLFEQLEAIKRLNETYNGNFQIFAGLECDILKDGQLDFSNEILKKLDFVIISIHRFFNMEEEEMTTRLLSAIENPYSTMVGHLTGRLLRHRSPYKVNVQKVIDACITNGKIIELNSYPDRMDMDWRYWIKAKEKGLKCSINPDAHSIKDLRNCQYGINIARKGWLEKNDVINTMPLKEMRAFLAKNKLKRT